MEREREVYWWCWLVAPLTFIPSFASHVVVSWGADRLTQSVVFLVVWFFSGFLVQGVVALFLDWRYAWRNKDRRPMDERLAELRLGRENWHFSRRCARPKRGEVVMAQVKDVGHCGDSAQMSDSEPAIVTNVRGGGQRIVVTTGTGGEYQLDRPGFSWTVVHFQRTKPW